MLLLGKTKKASGGPPTNGTRPATSTPHWSMTQRNLSRPKLLTQRPLLHFQLHGTLSASKFLSFSYFETLVRIPTHHKCEMCICYMLVEQTLTDDDKNTTATRRRQHSQECKDPRRQCFFVTSDLDIWPCDLKINGFPGLILAHLYAKFGDPSCVRFWDIVRKNRHTDKRR